MLRKNRGLWLSSTLIEHNTVLKGPSKSGCTLVRNVILSILFEKKKRKWIFQGNTFESAMFSTIFFNPLCAAPVFLCIDINPQESVHVYALTFLRDLAVCDASIGMTSEFWKLALLRCTEKTLRSRERFRNFGSLSFYCGVKSKTNKIVCSF